MSSSNGYKYADCRLLGHMWKTIAVVVLPYSGKKRRRADTRQYRQTIQCQRPGCGAVRKDLVELSGLLDRRSYKHPKDYRLDSFTPRDRQAMRLSTLKRAAKGGK